MNAEVLNYVIISSVIEWRKLQRGLGMGTDRGVNELMALVRRKLGLRERNLGDALARIQKGSVEDLAYPLESQTHPCPGHWMQYRESHCRRRGSET
jgi:hypothetical protein